MNGGPGAWVVGGDSLFPSALAFVLGLELSTWLPVLGILFLVGVLEVLRRARRRAAAAAAEAAAQRDLLETVFGSMAEGVAAFDGELRLTVANKRWASIRDYPERLVSVGRPMEEFVLYDARRGVYGPGEPDEVAARVLGGIRADPTERTRVVAQDGRILETRGAPLPDGGLVRTVSDVTEEHRARERFRVLFESSPEGHFLVQKGRVIDCNGAALKLMGAREKAEVMGQGLAEFLGGELGAGAMRDLLRRADREGEIREDWTLPRHDGDPIPLEVTVRRVDLTPGEDALLVVLHDLRERKGMERALRESQEFLKGVVDYSSALISAKDLEGRYILVNPRWEQVMGLSRRNVLGRTDRELFAEEVAVERQRDDREAIEAGGPRTTEQRTWVAGRARDFLTVAFPIMGPDGRPSSVCRVSTDVTQLKDVQGELEVARDRAEAADRAKGDFLANMSHEIRTPMNAIIGLTHLVLRSDLDAHQREQLQKIEAASRSLLGILNDILDFSKIEAGRLDMEEVVFHLEEVIGNVVDLFAMRAEEKGVELLVHVVPRTPVRLRGDPLRLGQVLTNLVSNAVKFTEAGEIVIRVEPDRVGVGTARLRFSVRDTGAGLSAEQASRLFTAFSQGDSSTTRRFGGTGLGLAISRRLVELMGGEIGVDSIVGEGSTFRFTAAFGRETNEVASSPRVPDLRAHRVLVADDNESARDILREMLEGFGMEVACVPSGEDAVVEARAAALRGEPYSLALVDWRMPGLDGFDVAERLRSDAGEGEAPKTVLVTAHGRDEVFQQKRERGHAIDAVLLKPLTPSILFDTLLEAVGLREPGREPSGPGGRRKRRRSGPSAAPTLRGARVLLVEDNEVNREVALGLLGEAGIEVETACDGAEALELLNAIGPDFDAVLMDVHMPVMDGYEATAGIRADDALSWIPVLAMTAGAMQEDRDRAFEAGMDDHIAKPVDMDELFQKLERWIQEGDRRRAEAMRSGSPQAAGAPAGAEAGPHGAGVSRGGSDGVGQGGGEGSAENEQGEEWFPDPDVLRVAGVDPLRGLRNSGGNEILYRRILQRFVETQSGVPAEIREAVEGDRVDDAVRAAHTLKGLAGTVGAEGLQRRALRLEQALREGTAEGVRASLASVEGDLMQIRAASGFPATGADDAEGATDEGEREPALSGSGKARVSAEVAELLDRLDVLVAKGDTRAVTLVEELEAGLAGTPVAKVGADVTARVRNYEFESARHLLRRVRESIILGEEVGT
jgi:two-component system, sensor histidine kinase and response regulator